MSCNIFPFKTLVILPAYGPNVARILWSVGSPVYNKNSCSFQIQKSKDGFTNWFNLDLTDPATNTEVTIDDGSFLDNNLGRYNQQVEWYYRLVVTENNTKKIYSTDPITYRHNLTDLEFGNIKEILSLEYISPDNIPMFLCRPNTVKEDPMNLENISSSINPLTGQVMGGAVDDIGYGKTYGNATSPVSAFSKPALVYITILSNIYQQKDLENGHGSIDNIVTRFKTFAYPIFKKGDMLVDPINDRRYLFDQIEQISEFKGIIPLTFTGKMTQLSRNDPMYLYQLPQCAIDYILNLQNN